MDVCLIPIPTAVVFTTVSTIDPLFIGGIIGATSVTTIAVMKVYEHIATKNKEKND